MKVHDEPAEPGEAIFHSEQDARKALERHAASERIRRTTVWDLRFDWT